MKLLRTSVLFFSFAFGVIGLGVAINALVKANDVASSILARLPAGFTVDINVRDIKDVGIVLAVGCGLSAVLSLVALISGIFLASSSLFRRMLPLLAGLLAFVALWIFACVIPFDVFYANRKIGVSAAVLGKAIDAKTINQVVSALGASLRYHDYDFLRLLAILPWFSFLFAALSAAMLLAERRQAPQIGGHEQNIRQEKV